MSIHPTAIVHPTAILGPEVSVGEGTRIGPYCYFEGRIEIGARNVFSSHVMLGQMAEHRKKMSVGSLVIGDDNVFRELFVMHRGTGLRDTRVGSRCYFLDHVHISHDAVVEDDVTISHNSVLGGGTIVQKGATLGILTAIHQHSVIGAFAMTGMGSVISRDVPPLALVAGNPARFKRLNTSGFARAGITAEEFSIKDGKLVSEHSGAQALWGAFEAASKRSRLAYGRL